MVPHPQPQLRQRAASDLDEAIAYLRSSAGDTVALAFIDAVEQRMNQIARAPHTGSLRFAFELGIPELRALPLRRFPYMIFYVSTDDRIDIWRILHTRRDIPATLTDGN